MKTKKLIILLVDEDYKFMNISDKKIYAAEGKVFVDNDPKKAHKHIDNLIKNRIDKYLR